MYKQLLDPVSHSLGDSSIFAVLSLLLLFMPLGGVRMKAQWASLISLAAAVVVAIAVYGMPFGQAVDAGARLRRSASSRSCGSCSTRCGSST
jgi:lactate permease